MLTAVQLKLKEPTPKTTTPYSAAQRAYAATVLNRAWNHLWLDSEDTRALGLELIVLYNAMQAVKHGN